jgi:hypothetical protein
MATRPRRDCRESACAPVDDTADSGRREAEAGASHLLDELRLAGLVKHSVRCNLNLLAAASKAYEEGLLEESCDDEQRLRALLPAGKKLAELLVWLRHLRELRDTPPWAEVARKRPRCAADCSWLLNMEARQGEAPASPQTWRVETRRAVGAGWASSTAAVRLLLGLDRRESLKLQVVALPTIKGDCMNRKRKTTLEDLLDAGAVPYGKVVSSCSTTRTTLLQTALPRRGGRLGAPPALARCGFQFELGPAPTSTESLVQVWVNFAEGTCQWHWDAPDSVLLCLGGTKSVSLLHPQAVAALGLPTMGERKLAATFDAFTHARLPECASGGRGLRHTVRLERGDALFIPSGWWHQIHSETETVALSVPVRVVRSQTVVYE